MSLPPPPINDKPGSFTWLEWYRQLRNYVSTSGSVPWYIINFAGSNITDIADRKHNNLQNLQGGTNGEMYHLTATQYSVIANSASGTWTPTFTNLTEVPGTDTITKTGRYNRIGNIVFYTVTITCTGTATTESTAASTYFSLPIPASHNDTLTVVDSTTNLSIGTGVLDAVNGRGYPSSWTATSSTITISGKYEV